MTEKAPVVNRESEKNENFPDSEFSAPSTRNRDKLTQWCVKLSRNETGKSFCQLQQRIGTAPADTDGETVKHRKRGKTGGKDYEHVDQIESW